MIDPINDPRMAGQVQRYHVWPVLQPQTNSEHSWQVARIVLAIYPEASSALMQAALFHDIGEQSTGDIPFPVKSEHAVLKATMDYLEERACLLMAPWGLPNPTRLSEHDAHILKFADLIEMMEKGLQERLLGNRFADLIIRRTYEKAMLRLDFLSSDVRRRAQNYVQKRLQAWPSEVVSPKTPWKDGMEHPFGYDAEMEV